MIEHSYSYYAVFVGDRYNQTLVNICNNRGGGACFAGSSEVERIILHGGNGNSIFTDNDGDGLPDILEVEGMYGLNGHVYYSDPELQDTDGDGLLDGEEMGEMYCIKRISSVSVDINSNVIPVDDLDSYGYYFLNRFIPDNTNEIRFVFSVNSYPRIENSDRDDFWDGHSKELRPLINDITTIDLGGGTYSVHECDSGYIHVSDVPEEIWFESIPDPNTGLFYGGDQNWFGNITFGYNGINLFIENTGCGLIATHDVMYYLEYGSSVIPWESYRESVISVNSGFIGAPTWAVAATTGMPLLALVHANNSYAISPRFIQAYFLAHGYSTNYVKSDNIVFDNTLESIIDSLEADHPVILLTDTREGSSGIRMHPFDDFSHVYSSDYHYVTITGVYEYFDSVYLRCQSWGTIYFVDYNQFCSNCSSGDETGGMLFIS